MKRLNAEGPKRRYEDATPEDPETPCNDGFGNDIRLPLRTAVLGILKLRSTKPIF